MGREISIVRHDTKIMINQFFGQKSPKGNTSFYIHVVLLQIPFFGIFLLKSDS